MTTLGKFEYFAPRTLKEAVSLMRKYGKKAKILAGGTDLIPLMKRRAVSPRHVIDIGRVPGMDYVKFDEKRGLRIGALTTVRAVKKSKVIQERYPFLFEAAHEFGTAQVQSMATVGGNLCRASPAADMAVPLLALDAQAIVAGPRGRRTIQLEKFFRGPGETVLKQDEVLTEVRSPVLKPRTGTAFLKLRRTYEDLAKLNVAVSLTTMKGTCRDVKIALGAVAPTPIRARKAEETLRGKKLVDSLFREAARKAADETKPVDDVRSTAEYRKEASRVLVERALKKAFEKVK